MKYFKIITAVKTPEKTRLISEASAKQFYAVFMKKIDSSLTDEYFTDGTEVRSPSGFIKQTIWGEDISDAQVFLRLLTGSVVQ